MIFSPGLGRLRYSFVSRESPVENRLLRKMSGNNRKQGVEGEKQKKVVCEKGIGEEGNQWGGGEQGVAGRLRT